MLHQSAILIKETLDEIRKISAVKPSRLLRALNSAPPELLGLKLLTYLKNTTGRTLKQIGKGSSRIVMAIDESTVLKVARNTAGQIQNRNEANISHRFLTNHLICRVLDSGTESTWIISERMIRPAKITDFKARGFKNLDDLLDRLAEKGGGGDPISNLILKEFKELLNFETGEATLWESDLMRSEHWGIVQRHGIEDLVIIDWDSTQKQ